MSKLYYPHEVSDVVKLALVEAVRDALYGEESQTDTHLFKLTRIETLYKMADFIEAELNKPEKEGE